MIWVLWRSSGSPDTAPRQRVALAAAQCAGLARPYVSADNHALFDECFEAVVSWAYTPSRVRLDALINAANQVFSRAKEHKLSPEGDALAAIGTAATTAVDELEDDTALYVVSHVVSATFLAGTEAIEREPGCPGVFCTSFAPATVVAATAMERDLHGRSCIPRDEVGHEVKWTADWINRQLAERLLYHACFATLRECADVVRALSPEPPHSLTPRSPPLTGEDEIVCRASEDLPLRVRAFALHCIVFSMLYVDDLVGPLSKGGRRGPLKHARRRPLPPAHRGLVHQVMSHYFLRYLTWLLSQWLEADPGLVARWRSGLLTEFQNLTGRNAEPFLVALDEVERQRDTSFVALAAAGRYVEVIAATQLDMLMEQGMLLAGLGERFVTFLQQLRDKCCTSRDEVTKYFLSCEIDDLMNGPLTSNWAQGDLVLHPERKR